MAYDITLVELPEQSTAVVRGHVARERLGDFVGRAFGTVMTAASRQGRRVNGPPFTCYRTMDGSGWDVEVGFPVDGPLADAGDVVPSHLPGGRAARLVHTGAYDTVGDGWSALSSWVADNGYAATGSPWECYLDGPEVAAPRTLIVMPCAEPVTG